MGVSLNDHFFKIASKGSTGELWEPQRKYDHIFEVYDVLDSNNLSLTLVGGFRPNETISEYAIAQGHTTTYIAQKIEREAGELRCIDYVSPDTAKLVYNWYNLVRDPETGEIYPATNYMREGAVLAYWTDRQTFRKWLLHDCFPTNVNMNDWDYSDSSIQEISLTIRYKTFTYKGTEVSGSKEIYVT